MARLVLAVISCMSLACTQRHAPIDDGRGSTAAVGRAPQAPGSVHVRTDAETLTLTVSWESTDTAAERWLVGERPAPDDPRFFGLDAVPAEARSWTSSPMWPGERHCYTVIAANAAGNSAPSDTVCANAALPPDPVRDLDYEGFASGLRLTWTANPSLERPVARFVVRIDGKAARELTPTERTVELPALGDGSLHDIAVAAVNAAGETTSAIEGILVGSPEPWLPWTSAVRPGFAVEWAGFAGRLIAIGAGGDAASAALLPSGRPGTWTPLAFPPRSPGALTTADGRTLLAVGESALATSPASGPVNVLRLDADRTSGNWVSGGEPFAPGAVRPGAAVLDGRLYVAGGYWWSGGSHTGYGCSLPFVRVGDLGPSGSVSKWRATTPLPIADRVTAALGHRRHLYVLIGDANELFHAAPATDGTIASWKRATAQPPFPSRPLLAAWEGHLYAVGSESPSKLFVAILDGAGEPIAWSAYAADNLPRDVPIKNMVAASGRLFAFEDSPSSSRVFVANIDPTTGHLATIPWSPRSAPVAELRATTVDAGLVRVSWNPGADGGSGLLRCDISVEGGPNPGYRATTFPCGHEATVAGLDPLSPVRISVRPFNSAGAGPSTVSNLVTPWASPTWRPGILFGTGEEFAALAGNMLIVAADRSSYRAPLDTAGEPWTTLGRDAYSSRGRARSSAAAASLRLSDSAACLYLTGGFDGTKATSSVEAVCRADDGLDGTPVAGMPSLALDLPRYGHAAVTVDGRLYVLGGRKSPDAAGALADVSFSALTPGAAPGVWTRTTPLPSPAESLAAVADGKRIYVVAPSFAPDRVFVSEASADGTLGAWRATGPALPFPRTRPAAIVVRNHLYVLGNGVIVGTLDGAGEVVSWLADWGGAYAGAAQTPTVVARGDRLYLWGDWSRPDGTAPVQIADLDPVTGRPIPWR